MILGSFPGKWRVGLALLTKPALDDALESISSKLTRNWLSSTTSEQILAAFLQLLFQYSKRSSRSAGAVRGWVLCPTSKCHFNPRAKGNLEAWALSWWTIESFSAWEEFVNDAIVIICMWNSLSFTYQFNAPNCNSQSLFRRIAWRKTPGCSPSVLVSSYLLQNNFP